MAALERTTPRRVVARPLVLRIVKVVPREVEHRAAPAAKAWSGVAEARAWRGKERAMGRVIPVMATAMERKRLALRDLKEVESPPLIVRKGGKRQER
jgi:hypothetical protein